MKQARTTNLKKLLCSDILPNPNFDTTKFEEQLQNLNKKIEKCYSRAGVRISKARRFLLPMILQKHRSDCKSPFPDS